MTEEKISDNRTLGRRLLTGLMVVVLAAAVPIAKCTHCGDPLHPEDEAREPGITDGFTGAPAPAWATVSEGLRYLPADVASNLKRPAKDGLRLIDEPLFERPERFGMLPDPEGGPFPLGITVSDDPDMVPMIGITCGACHVGAVSNGKNWVLVPGAPNLMSVNVFFGEMIRSLAATLASPEGLDELWKAYAEDNSLEAGAEPPKAALTQQEVAAIMVGQGHHPATSSLNDAFPQPQELDSRARLSAYLVARLVELVGRANGGGDGGPVVLGTSDPWSSTRALFGKNFAHQTPPSVGASITAPDIYRYRERKWVFWSQVTNSMVERNLAQGLALLGDVDWKTYASTLDDRGLVDIQEGSETLQPPKWPVAILGTVDASRARRGCRTFFTRCANCHEYVHPDDRGSLEFGLYDVGTDGAYCAGVNTGVTGFPTVPDLVRPVAAQVKVKAFGTDHSPSEDGRWPVVWRPMECNKFPARSLEGVWATAPYLHNGSVRTMDDLLKPAVDREKRFNVGSIQYDPDDLGFVSSDLPHATPVDTTLHGMSNSGHEFIVDVTERRDLIEYLKVHVDGKACE